MRFLTSVLLLVSLMVIGTFSGLAQATPDLPPTLRSDKPVLLEFFAAWCGTCRQMQPHINALGKDLKGKLHVVRVDVDQAANAPYVQLFEVQGTPTYFLFDRSGKPLYSMSRMISPVMLRQEVIKRVSP
jgi:thioredoxin 1